MVRLCERFGSYRTYAEEPTFAGLGEGLPARYDAVRNFLRTGGRFGRDEPLERLASRTNYFRETYAYGDEVRIDGIEPFLRHEGFVEAARRLHGRPVVEPAIVYANLLVPGQELAVHTDVPEFRGVNRQRHPQWLIVVMHHSGLFDAWRMPIATAVAWFQDCNGGEFVFYPDGPGTAPRALPVRRNTAILLDTDSVFHGVDRLAETRAPVDRLRPGMRLAFDGDGRWSVFDGQDRVARYGWDELRFSISWKAYCFADEAERRTWREHGADLSVDAVVARLVADLRARGRIGGEPPAGKELVDLLIDAYVAYPESRVST
ncbi:MAG TPA: hypothetical protein VKA21_11900 [Candidatus Binatia bacterium]|nr:hypothetical protein [Candidatus Binatia bacterium]